MVVFLTSELICFLIGAIIGFVLGIKKRGGEQG